MPPVRIVSLATPTASTPNERAGWGCAIHRGFHGIRRHAEGDCRFQSLARQAATPIQVVIAGNHDLMFERHPEPQKRCSPRNLS